ncbi:hypothetical protein [Amycolatopsis sp. lyj-23]|uniref:hypothetical protein n=1 Tax=Amycolatopsis sp. lyj-23 TaxID=2789283 RepID=UPI00397E0D8D
MLHVAPGNRSFLEGQLRTAWRFDAGLRCGAVQVMSVDAIHTTGTVARSST